MSEVTKECPMQKVKNQLSSDAERFSKTASVISAILGKGPMHRTVLHDLFNDHLTEEADIDHERGEMVHIDHTPFDTAFDRMVAQEWITELDDGRYGRSDCEASAYKLPEYTFPRRIFGNDKLRDDLRKWLLDWHNANPDYDSDGSLFQWQTCGDRHIKMLDATLTALAPFFIELLAPRAGSPIRAAELLAKRFEATAQELATDEEERAEAGDEVGWSFPVDWFRADDVNLYSGFYDEVIGHPRQEP